MKTVYQPANEIEKDALLAWFKLITWKQRLAIANYLNSIEYKYPENEPPKMDKSFFKAGSMDELFNN